MPGMSIEIIKLGSNQVDLALQLFLFYQRDDGIENPTQGSDKYLKNLLSRTDFHVIVAVENEKVIGGLTAYELRKYKDEEREMFLYEIAVEAEYRRKGVGRALIEYLQRICREKGIGVMFVGALENNQPALKLYRATGGRGEKVVEFAYEIDLNNE